jgi:hypothetical protein
MPLPPSATARDVDFSPDGRRLLISWKDPASWARVWDVASGQPLAPPFAVDGPAAFRPDGRAVVAGTGASQRQWELPEVDWPVEDLLRLAQVLSGRQDDSHGDLSWWYDEDGATWAALHARYHALAPLPK